MNTRHRLDTLPNCSAADTGVGVRCFVEMHRRVLGGKFGSIPKWISDDAFSMGGYCLDATELIPAGGCYAAEYGGPEDHWVVVDQIVTTRGEGP